MTSHSDFLTFYQHNLGKLEGVVHIKSYNWSEGSPKLDNGRESGDALIPPVPPGVCVQI